jgi:polysaccharide chain length determinant protein (PEP-CTERM system associated)
MWSDRQLTFTDYWLIAWRHRWLLILPFVTICIGTVLYNRALPDIYRASTSVLVEAPKVPESYIHSTVPTGVQDRLRTITQQIKSRTRLEQVARELQLISPSLEGKVLDDYMTKMSKSIEVTVQGSGNDIFIVFYEGQDPHTVMLVANKLASLFIDANLKMREQYAEGTTEFLESELQGIRNLLQTQEKTLAEYKQRYMGELPSDQSTNQRTLDRLQTQLQSIVLTLESVRTRKSLILRQLSQQESEAAFSTIGAARPSREPSGLEQQLAQHRLTLATLQRIYVDKYPDIIRLKQEIAELEAQIAGQDSGSRTTESVQPVDMALKSARRQQQQEIEQIDQEEIKLRQQQANIQEQIAAYEKKIANASLREQESLVLSRDYESTRKSYDSLLGRRQQAQIAENLEKRQKSEQFRVLDEARIPTKPWKPKRPMILLAGMGLGLAVGVGAVVVAAYLDRAFHDPEDLEQCTALPVLATVPFLMTTVEQRKQRLQRRFFYATCMLIPSVTIVAVHFLWMKLDVLFTRTLTLLNF